MNKRIGITLVVLICLTAVGCSYGVRADTTVIEATARIEQEHHSLEFTAATCGDNESGIDVATCDVVLEDSTGDGLKDKLKIAIGNAYPGYEAYADFTLKNVGGENAHIKSVTISNPNLQALSVSITPLESITLEPDETVDGKVTVHVLQGAEQKHTYTFNIVIRAEEIWS